MTARFGPFALDAETRQLRRGTAVIPLMPKAFDLVAVYRRAGGSVSTEARAPSYVAKVRISE